jgi:hypothetical protein
MCSPSTITVTLSTFNNWTAFLPTTTSCFKCKKDFSSTRNPQIVTCTECQEYFHRACLMTGTLVSPELRPVEKKTSKWLVLSVTCVPLQVIFQPCLQFPPKEQPKLTLPSHLKNGLWDERSRHYSSLPSVNLLQGQVQLQDCVHNTQLRSSCPMSKWLSHLYTIYGYFIEYFL